MSLAAQFISLLVLTLVLLSGAVASGLGRRRRTHFALVASVFVSLGLTIWAAERLGTIYDFASAGLMKPIHLALAKAASLSYLLPLITGIRLLRGAGSRGAHRLSAFFAILLTVIAAVTGVWMILLATPL